MRVLALLLVMIVGCVREQGRFEERRLGGADGPRYRVWLPEGYDDTANRLPAVLFLHGLGEGGRDGKKPTAVGLGPALRKHKFAVGIIGVFPQVRGDWRAAGKQDHALAVLDDAQRAFRIDRERVALCGLSTGGYGAWAIAARAPGRFRALVQFCARSKSDAAIAGVPVWMFHNQFDPIVWHSDSVRMEKALRAAGNGDVTLTTYFAAGHNCWDRALRDRALWTWLRARFE